MLPLIVRPATMASERWRHTAGTPEFNHWVGPAVLRAGRRRRHLRPAGRLPDRPAGSAARADLEHPALRALRLAPPASPPRSPMLLVLRCLTFIGVCVEFVAAVAWLAELFPDPRQRESVLGYTQAFSSIGGLLVTGAYYLAVTYGAGPAGDPRRPRGVALHADVGRHPGHPADHHPAVPARVAGLAGRRRPPARCGGPAWRTCSRRRCGRPRS